jgi:benzylsuccinate CoA-transferase BbsF subunit
VIKVESSLRSEYTNRGHMFPALNNSKRSVSIDIANPEGRELIRDLVRISDIVVENFSGRVLTKHGLDYPALRSIRDDLIFVSASGVGRTGPQKDMLAYGTLLQAYSGRASMIGEPNPRLERMGILPAWTDLATAYWEVLAILSALVHRDATGAGAYIDQSMLESTVALIPESLLNESLGTVGDVPSGNRETDAAPSGCFRCAGEDDWLALSVRTDAEWLRLCAVLDRPDLAADSRLSNAEGRLAGKSELDRIVAAWLRSRTGVQAEALLGAAGLFAAWSRNILDLLEDPLLTRRTVFPQMANGKRTIALPWMEEDGWRGDFTASPELGADNDYVLGDILGLSPARIAELTDRGVIR